MSWLWVVLPVGFALTLAVAWRARLRRSFAPLVVPAALSTLALGAWVLVEEGRLAASNGLLIVILAPLLVFCVRTTVVAFQAVFRHRRGVDPRGCWTG